MCLVYDSGANTVSVPRAHATSTGVPYVVFGDTVLNQYNFSKYSGSWVTSSIWDKNSVHQWVASDFIINSVTDIELYVCFNTTTSSYINYNGGDLWKFVSTNGGSTWKLDTIIYAGQLPAYNPRVVYNFNSELKIFFGHPSAWSSIQGGAYEGRFEVFSVKLKLYAWGDNGYVYRRHKW